MNAGQTTITRLAEGEKPGSTDNPSPDPTSGELRDAAGLAEKIVLAVKNRSLYPESHAIVLKSCREAHERLLFFAARYGAFVLGVEKDHFHYRGREVSRRGKIHGDLAYKCFRDGIEYFVFSEDLVLDEIVVFTGILGRRSMMEEDGEGDIVTDMWEAALGGIKYIVNDNLWKNEPMLDLSALKIVPETRDCPPPGASPSFSGTESPEFSPGVGNGDIAEIWTLTPKEQEITKRMVVRENNRIFDRDVFDVLLLILAEQRQKEDFSVVLDVFAESFRRSIGRCEFALANRFLFNLQGIYEKYRSGRHWALPLLDDFWLAISSPRILAPVSGCLSAGRNIAPGLLKDLESMLSRLSPESILTLLPMAADQRSVPVRNHINRAVFRLASRDPRPLYQLAKSASPPVARQALMNLSRLGKNDHLSIILECTRSGDVLLRRVAVKALTRLEGPVAEHVLPFAGDADDIIRKTAFNFLVRRGGVETETCLIDYLGKLQASPANGDSLILLYGVLGRIGSKQALDFFIQRLFRSPWRAGKTRAIHRRGAAAGLLEHRDPEAAAGLARAAKSLWPTIRRPARSVSKKGENA